MSSLIEKIIKDSGIRFMFYLISGTVTITVSFMVYYNSLQNEIHSMPDKIAIAVVSKIDSLKGQVQNANRRMDTITNYLRITAIIASRDKKEMDDRMRWLEERLNEFIRPAEINYEKKRRH